MLNRFKYLLKGILLYLFLIIITLFKGYKIISVMKIIIFILMVTKWLNYVSRDNKIIYFKKSFECILLYWICLMVNLFIESKVNALFFVILSGIVWVFALVLGFKAGSEFLTVINEYYPYVMKEYYALRNFGNKVKNLEMELHKIKENAPLEVVDAITKREMIKPVALFHLEMIILSLCMLWPLYLY